MIYDYLRWRALVIKAAIKCYRADPHAGLIVLASTRQVLSKSNVPPFFRSNMDYGEGWTAILDNYRKKQKKRLKKKIKQMALDRSLKPIDSYCGSKDNKEYWSSAGDTPAVRDFVEYVDQVKC